MVKRKSFLTSGTVLLKIMPQDDWEQIHYQELPDWMKEGLKPDRRTTQSSTRIFSGKPFNYKVQYTVTGDIVSVSYWRSAPPATPAPKVVKKPDRRMLVVAILVLLAGAAVFFLTWSPRLLRSHSFPARSRIMQLRGQLIILIRQSPRPR